jgi:hypothetical protein
VTSLISLGKDVGGKSLRQLEVIGWRLEDGRADVRSQMSGVGGYRAGRAEVRRQVSKITFIWNSGLLIFLFSVVLEVVQFYLPYRTFNVYDVVANGIGILFFVVAWMLFISHPEAQRLEVRGQRSEIRGRQKDRRLEKQMMEGQRSASGP